MPAGSLARQVWILAFPMLGEQFVLFLLGIVDRYLAGQISKEATTAVGSASYVAWLVSLTFMLVGTGAAALVSRSFGAGDRRLADRVLSQTVLMMLFVGLFGAAVTWLLAPWLASVLTPDPDAHAIFVPFVRIDLWGYLGYALTVAVNTVLRSSGDTRTPTLIMVIVNIANAALSAALAFGLAGLPALGVLGIAYGTAIARWTGAVLALGLVIHGFREFRLRWSGLRPDFGIIGRMLRVGIPGAADGVMFALTHALFITIVARSAAGVAGTVNFAAHIVAVGLEAISYMPAIAWANAASVMVGQYLGANRPERAGRVAHVAALQCGALAALLSVAFFVLAEPLFRLMTKDADVVAVGAPAFRIMAFFQIPLCLGMVYVASLRGAGDTRFTMVITFFSGLLLRVPVAYIGAITLGGGLLGAWCGMWADNVARCLLGIGRYVQGGWKRVRV